MLSYLGVISGLVSENIYQNGQKIFLDGKVLNHKDLILDYWREYDVKGRQKNAYKVRIPILHLALDQKKFELAGEALEESVSCECEYFRDYGICKHIVAVCASLETEFGIGLKKTKSKIENKEAGEVMDKIFEAEAKRVAREFYQNLEEYLETNMRTSFTWVDEFIKAESEDSESFSETRNYFKSRIQEAIRSYEKEPKLVRLAIQILIFNSSRWWDFWLEIIPDLTENRQLEIQQKLWDFYLLGLTSEYQNSLENYYASLDQQIKDNLLDRFQKKYRDEQEKWIEFTFISKNINWLKANLQVLDPRSLIRLNEYLPDMHEELEEIIAKQIVTWSDFLETGDYNEFIEVIRLWQKKMGGSEVSAKTINYIRQTHRKKRTLIQELRNLTS